jgi:hypothetical protein
MGYDLTRDADFVEDAAYGFEKSTAERPPTAGVCKGCQVCRPPPRPLCTRPPCTKCKSEPQREVTPTPLEKYVVVEQ